MIKRSSTRRRRNVDDRRYLRSSTKRRRFIDDDFLLRRSSTLRRRSSTLRRRADPTDKIVDIYVVDGHNRRPASTIGHGFSKFFLLKIISDSLRSSTTRRRNVDDRRRVVDDRQTQKKRTIVDDRLRSSPLERT